MQATKTTADAECRDSIVFWFVVLDKAREQFDFERAAEAVRELRRLGVIVRFQRKEAVAQ